MREDLAQLNQDTATVVGLGPGSGQVKSVAHGRLVSVPVPVSQGCGREPYTGTRVQSQQC